MRIRIPHIHWPDGDRAWLSTPDGLDLVKERCLWCSSTRALYLQDGGFPTGRTGWHRTWLGAVSEANENRNREQENNK